MRYNQFKINLLETISISDKVGEINEDSPDTPAGSRTKDLNLGKLWLLTELKRLGMDKFDTVYVLGSWYGSMAPYMLHKHIMFDTAYLIDKKPKNTEFVQRTVKKLGINDVIIPVTQNANTTEYKGQDILVINTSTNDMQNAGWLDRIPAGSVVAIQGRDNQPSNPNNTEQTLEAFDKEHTLTETLLLDSIQLTGVEGDTYLRFMKIGIK